MSSVRRSAFTIVELLVVIAIITVLAALLLPAVQAARESAHRTWCNSRMQDITKATVTHATQRGRFPGHTENFYDPNPTDPNFNFVSWPLLVLPYLDQENLYNDWRQKAAMNNLATAQRPRLELFLCPSDPGVYADTTNRTSYVGNAGSDHREHKADGFFLAVGGIIKVTLTDIEDGTSNVILITENSQAGLWDSPGKGETVFVFYLNGSINPNIVINADQENPAVLPTPFHRRPASYHRGGVNAGFADGRIAFIDQAISYDVHRQLMTLDNANASFQFRQLSDGDY